MAVPARRRSSSLPDTGDIPFSTLEVDFPSVVDSTTETPLLRRRSSLPSTSEEIVNVLIEHQERKPIAKVDPVPLKADGSALNKYSRGMIDNPTIPSWPKEEGRAIGWLKVKRKLLVSDKKKEEVRRLSAIPLETGIPTVTASDAGANTALGGTDSELGASTKKSVHFDFTPAVQIPSREDCKKTSGGRSLPVETQQPRPDWYQDLSEEQISMFKEMFELLDRDGGGTIDTHELFVLMKDLDIDITKEEIEHVLTDLDKDKNGEIDFDEFLFAMAEANRFCEEINAKPERSVADEKYSKRQRLFFSAITRFVIKNTMEDIDTHSRKMRQAPHVISFYTAGVRLIGLNDHQLELRLRKMQREARGLDSPYAKPLPFVNINSNKKKGRSKSGGTTRSESCAERSGAHSADDAMGYRYRSADSYQADANPRRTSYNRGPAACYQGRRSSHPVPPDALKPTPPIMSDAPPADGDALNPPSSATNYAEGILQEDHEDEEALDLVHDPQHAAGLEAHDSELMTPSEVAMAENRQRALDSDEHGSRRRTIMPGQDHKAILTLLDNLANQGSVLARIPDVHLVPAIRQKLAQQVATGPSHADHMSSSIRKRRRTLTLEQQQTCAAAGITGGGGDRKTAASNDCKKDKDSDKTGGGGKQWGWVIPRIEHNQAPLPKIPIAGAYQRLFTIEDVPDIRERVSRALGSYYYKLKQVHVRNAWSHWNSLHTEAITHDNLRDKFRQLYCAYSPHKEEDVFVITPWIPGPRYTSRQPGKPVCQYEAPPRLAPRPPAVTRPNCSRVRSSGRRFRSVTPIQASSRHYQTAITTDSPQLRRPSSTPIPF